MKTGEDSPDPQDCKRILVIYGSKGKSDELLLSPQDPGHVCFLPRATDEFIVSCNIFIQCHTIFIQYNFLHYYTTIFIMTFLSSPKIYIYGMLAWLLRITYLCQRWNDVTLHLGSSSASGPVLPQAAAVFSLNFQYLSGR